jgi:hypothetical protein
MLSSLFARVAQRQALPSRVNEQKHTEQEWDGHDEIFDVIARTLGSPMPRRQALRMALTGLVGAALADVGVKTAWAAPTCLCRTRLYDPEFECCTPSGVQRKKDNPNINLCPQKVINPQYACEPNGCGSEGGRKYPPYPMGADFLTCCGAPGTSGAGSHDCCWGQCGMNRNTCDLLFLGCLNRACEAKFPGSGIIDTIKRESCLNIAFSYFLGVASPFATSAYDAGQSKGCDCCGTTTCPQSCAGSSCGSLPGCAPGGDCVCFTSTEGTGACVHGNTPCSSVPRCSTTADCPAGFACLTTSCCGPIGVCGPLCSPIGSPIVQQQSLPLSSQEGPTLGGFH